MSAQVLFYFTAFLVIIVSQKSAFARRSSNVEKTKNLTDFNSGKVIVKGNYNAVNLYPDKDVKKALTQLEKKVESLEGRLDALEKFKSACEFDFEHGIDDWKKTGTVFNNQPTYGDNPTARNRGQPANQQGNWWIGGAENRSSKSSPAGNTQGDGPQGTLTSPFFTITGKNISFLIGGGCDIKLVRAELVVGSKVVKQATGRCNETMTREAWDVGTFVGQRARVKLVDSSSVGWGHINFDDLRGDMSCGQN